MSEHEKVLQIIALKRQAPFSIDPGRTALLVIDVQRYLVHPDHPFGQVLDRLVPGATAGYFDRVRRTVLPAIRRLQDTFRDASAPIFYTATGSLTPTGCDLPGWLRNFDDLGRALLGKRVWPPVDDPSWQVDDAVAPRTGEFVLHKASSGPLASTRLDQTLRHMGIESLVVTGLTTDVCVTQTAREAADRGFSVVIAEDACTTLSAEMHRGSLDVFALAFGRVEQSAEIVRLLSHGFSGVTATAGGTADLHG